MYMDAIMNINVSNSAYIWVYLSNAGYARKKYIVKYILGYARKKYTLKYIRHVASEICGSCIAQNWRTA